MQKVVLNDGLEMPISGIGVYLYIAVIK